jgi:RimJ/RimL family protein N-acetyltransferase
MQSNLQSRYLDSKNANLRTVLEFLIFLNDEPVGYGGIHVLASGSGGAIVGLCLDERARGKGMGKATMGVLLRLSNEIAADGVEAGTMRGNVPMRALARSLGLGEREEVVVVEGRGVVAEILFGGIERERLVGLEMGVVFGEVAP